MTCSQWRKARVSLAWKNLPPNDWKPVEDWPAQTFAFAILWQAESSLVRVKLQALETVHRIQEHSPRQPRDPASFRTPRTICLKQNRTYIYYIFTFSTFVALLYVYRMHSIPLSCSMYNINDLCVRLAICIVFKNAAQLFHWQIVSMHMYVCTDIRVFQVKRNVSMFKRFNAADFCRNTNCVCLLHKTHSLLFNQCPMFNV